MDIEMHLLWLVPVATLVGILINVTVSSIMQGKTLKQTSEHHQVTYKTLEQNRITDLVIQERLKWTTDLRESFIEFNKCASQVIASKNKEHDEKVNAYIELRKKYDEIILMLNPNENYHVKVVDALVDVITHAKARLIGEESTSKTKRYKLLKLQNVLLKSEWARIKEETETGKILKDEEVKQIYKKFEEKTFSSEITDDIDM